MSAVHVPNSNVSPVPTLYMAFDLGWSTWKLAFSTGAGQPPRIRSMIGRDLRTLQLEIKRAKERLGLPADAPVVSCYEAGRDGFWLHRSLLAEGIPNIVVDPASIEVNRRKRRAKTDRLDAAKLVMMLIRSSNGEQKLWGVIQVPRAQDEDGRQLHRELHTLTDERTEHVNRIKGLLAVIGLDISVDAKLPTHLDELRQWDGTPVPEELRSRLLREFERWELVEKQIHELVSLQRRRIRDDGTPGVELIRLLLSLPGVGQKGAWYLVREFFGWREIRNRRQVGSLAGLTPTPYGSGDMDREQGISKAGNKRLRWLMVQLAWSWLRYQPDSELSKWYATRFSKGSARMRKVGIVAVARKLLVAFWRLVKGGQVPLGAEMVDWERKLSGKPWSAKAAVGES